MASTGGARSSDGRTRVCGISGREVPPALVLVVEPERASPWDPETLALVGGLEELLDGAHVAHAASGPGGPSLRDAFAAVRFAGATEVVVNAPPSLPERDLDRLLERAGAARLGMRVVRIRAEMDVHAVAGSYRAETARDRTRAA